MAFAGSVRHAFVCQCRRAPAKDEEEVSSLLRPALPSFDTHSVFLTAVC